MSEEPLPALEIGDGPERAVLLHGFGGSARTWDAVRERLGDAPSVAFDLPGHGAAVRRTDLSTVDARNAVLRELDRLGIERAHLVGHSRGGAVACLVAAKAPERVASLTLLAPGGFGPEIAGEELAAFARAATEAELRETMRPLYTPARPSKRAIAQAFRERQNEAAVPALLTIWQGMMSGGAQGTLRLDALESAAFPVTLFWGSADAVLPSSQAAMLPSADTRIIEGAGHMLPAEVPQTIADAVRTQFRTNSA